MTKILVFKNSGWCEELKTSFEKGRYTPKNEKELKALEKHASEVIELKPVKVNDGEKTSSSTEASAKVDFTEVEILELRAKGKASGIKNSHSMKPENLVKELKALEK